MAAIKPVLTPYEKRIERQLSAGKRYEDFSSLENAGCLELAAALAGEFGPGMDERFGRQIVEKGLWKEALSLAFHEDGRVAFRASWALEWAYFHDRRLFEPFVGLFLENYQSAENPSVHRHYTKMLCDMIRRKMFEPDMSQAGIIAEKTFDLLIGATTKSAVRVWAAEILYELLPRLEWVGENLSEVLRMQMETMPTPAILNHYGKLLRRMTGK